MLFLKYSMMEKLNLDFVTIPGKDAYESGSTPVRNLYFIAIIAEGKEECIYLDYIKSIVNEADTVKLNIEILNHYYNKEKTALSESHPLRRLDALKEWSDTIQKISLTDDEEWIICDRDNGSFTNDQYDELLADAETLGIHVIVSNPAFQIWLLFHFVKDITPLRLDDYPKSKDRLKIVESELKKYVVGYKHGSLEMDPFSEHIRDAMDNSQSDTQDLKELKRSSGTNFRNLLCSIQDKCNDVALFR